VGAKLLLLVFSSKGWKKKLKKAQQTDENQLKEEFD